MAAVSLRLLRPDMRLADVQHWCDAVNAQIKIITEPGTFSRIRRPLWDFCSKSASKIEKLNSLPVRIRTMSSILYCFNAVGVMPSCGTDTTMFFRIIRDAVEGICECSEDDLKLKYSASEIDDMVETAEYLMEHGWGTIDNWIKEDFELDKPAEEKLWKVGCVVNLGEKLFMKMGFLNGRIVWGEEEGALEEEGEDWEDEQCEDWDDASLEEEEEDDDEPSDEEGQEEEAVDHDASKGETAVSAEKGASTPMDVEN